MRQPESNENADDNPQSASHGEADDDLGDLGSARGDGSGWLPGLAALRHRNFRLFFVGSAISLIGTWMQTIAEGWLVYELTNSPLALGLVRFLHTIPVTGLTLIGGAIADRFSKRPILLTTQTVSMCLAFALAGLVYFEKVEVWHVAILGLMLGVAHSFDIPARQSFIIEMVGKKDLMNAIALNSSMFNGARIIGPAFAGLIMVVVGMAGCFFINGLSFLGVIIAYLFMKLPERRVVKSQKSIRQATLDGVSYVRNHAFLSRIMCLVIVMSLFGWPYSVLMPVFARDYLDLQGSGYSFLMAVNGLGAFLGAISLALLGNYPHKLRLLLGGLLGFSLSIIIFSLSRHVVTSAIILAVTGWFMIIFFATANSLVQLTVPDELRGRVMGIYSFCFIGISPIGSLIAGVLASWIGAPTTIFAGAIVCLCSVLWIGTVLRRQGQFMSPDPSS